MSTPVGGYVIKDGHIKLNEGRERVTVTVRNTGDRPIQIGSHFHFFEVNRALEFDRTAAFGMRLDIISSTAIRFGTLSRRPAGYRLQRPGQRLDRPRLGLRLPAHARGIAAPGSPVRLQNDFPPGG